MGLTTQFRKKKKIVVISQSSIAGCIFGKRNMQCKRMKVKNWKETAKDRIIWSDLAGKAKTHKGL
jgi:hypothetical protein